MISIFQISIRLRPRQCTWVFIADTICEGYRFPVTFLITNYTTFLWIWWYACLPFLFMKGDSFPPTLLTTTLQVRRFYRLLFILILSPTEVLPNLSFFMANDHRRWNLKTHRRNGMQVGSFWAADGGRIDCNRLETEDKLLVRTLGKWCTESGNMKCT
ncbi:hypothetical protein Mapa_013360 [Marchantia paleacea]|nr:hypothetical protein Mapa_013360 [Marchantia paleacea]